MIKSNDKSFLDLIQSAKKYNTAIDADLINSKSKKGHTLDNIPKNTELINVDSSLFEREKETYGKVSDYKIAYHNRPVDDKYWNKNIDKGIRPPVLIEFDEDNNQLRVRDGNHRLNVYLSKGIKQIPSVLTIQAKKFLESVGNNLKDGGIIKSNGIFKSLGSAKESGIRPKIAGHDMIAGCDCGEKFSYQNSKKDILWQCPECNGMKRIKTS